MALRLTEIEPRNDYLYVCTPTGNEPPEMFAHWRKLGELLGSGVVPVVSNTLGGLIESQHALPNWRQRWCTRILKIEPYAKFLESFKEGVVSYVGLRADEPEREGGDYLKIPGVQMRFPMREWGWTLRDVLGYLKAREVVIPKRTDCQLCFFQRLIEWYELWRDCPKEYAEGERLEAMTGHTFRSPARDSWPASLAGLRARFEAGFIPKETRGADPLNALKCRVCRI
jgi:hypothetical protein